ncbi:MAG: O-antigen ligase family protein, partial [Symploca sp. SIO2B6]|nr:O-antigen ligase family protein [Symploca sp. SIO2B6]
MVSAKEASSELDTQDSPRWHRRLFHLSIATLAYGFYPNLLGIFIVLIATARWFKRSCIDPLTRTSLFVVSVGMGVSTWMAMDRGEAVLQLTHFLPFFWLFITLPIVVRSPLFQSRIARDLVLTSIPINLVAIAEYAVKSNLVPSSFQGWGLLSGVIEQWRTAPHIGRAMVMFDHPNVLANYLAIIFGLGLGLILTASSKSSSSKSSSSKSSESSLPKSSISPWIWGATLLNLVGIFCSGSRNGILAVLLQVALGIVMVKLNRTLLLLGGISSIGFGLGAFFLGLGTRTIGITQVMDDPRVGIWAIAFDLIRARPWLGWGPGSFKFLYPERLINPEYDIVFHPHNLWLLLG